MKKKLAVFATGWSSELLHNYMSGLYEGFKEIDADIYMFMSFPTGGDPEAHMQGELNIFNLPDMHDFDAAFIIANGLDFPNIKEQLNKKCDDAGVPVIYTGFDDEKHYFVGADNYFGAKELAEHIITVHGAKDIFFIAGNMENPDSNTRMKALSDVMEAHGLKFSEENVYYSYWSPKDTMYFIRDWVDSGKKLPDAFVCANDSLAMVVCAEMRRIGLNVPRDIMSTGFDNEYLSSIYDPSISSVNQRFDKIGNACAKLAIRLFNGEECERSQTIPCEFVPSESCGCTSAKDFDNIRREIGRNKFLDAMNNSAFNRSLAHMERQILQGKTYSDIKDNIKTVIDTIYNYEGDSFHIILDPLFEETLMDSDKDLRTDGYPDIMDVIFSMDEKEIVDVDDFKTRDIVPFIKDKDKNHFFLCTPLHDQGLCMGYAVFGENIDRLGKAEDLQVYLDRLNNTFIKYKQTLSVDYLNRRLRELSETDALTHVKNRTAFNARNDQICIDIKNKKVSEFAVIQCDVNGLKQINDTYGHDIGDEYIINSCKLICNTFKRSAIYRMGGDEFAIILMGDDYKARHTLLGELNSTMAELKNKDIPVSGKISIACGMAEYDPAADTGVDEVLRRADIQMYENKQAMKKSS